MSKIYDCFLFFNELDLLELRLNILNDTVDYFVIVESTVTFSGNFKELVYENNKELFKDFHHKIKHIIIDDTPISFSKIEYVDDSLQNKILKYVDESTGWNRESEPQWGRETYQRECIIRGLFDCDDDDIIIISDLDEIPNNDEIVNINNDVVCFKQKMYCFYLNLLKEIGWSGTKACKWNILKDISLNHLRQNKHTTKYIENGGWHFSFMGGQSTVHQKIEAYSHQEFNNPHILDNIENNMNNNNDPFFRGQLTQVEIDNTYPKYLLDNLDKYKHMIK
jgi:beta-1,4-mannosyl-glycoprotein beta-1,4-N-acetylglucosaminyltransferase